MSSSDSHLRLKVDVQKLGVSFKALEESYARMDRAFTAIFHALDPTKEPGRWHQAMKFMPSWYTVITQYEYEDQCL